MKEINSVDNDFVKTAVRLRDRKRREENRLFVFEGKKLLFEAKNSGVIPERVLFTKTALENDPSLEAENGATLVSDAVYKKLSEEASPEGVLTVCPYLPNHESYSNPKDKSDFLLFLCGVRDPGNVGTILRAASAFGKGDLVISSDCADVYSQKTVRASMGAVFRTRTLRADSIEIAVKDFISAGKNVYAAYLDRTSLPLGKADKNAVFVLGNEGHGLSESVVRACTGKVFIPMEEGTESLNVSCAATVILWEYFR